MAVTPSCRRAQGAKIEHGAEGLLCAPQPPLLSWSHQLPATPARRHNVSGYAKAIEGLKRQGRTTESGLTQILKPINQQHINPSLGK